MHSRNLNLSFYFYSTLSTSSSPSGTEIVIEKAQLSNVQRLCFLDHHLFTPSLHLQVSTILSGSSASLNLPLLQYYTDPDEYEESVDALRKLAVAKNPPAQTVQDLLNVTREERERWLKRPDISIKDILQEYPVLKQPKWVSS